MKKSVKALLLVVCAVALVVATVFTTLAFLSKTTETIKNTFSIGNVDIKLEEADVDVYGEYAKVDEKIVWEEKGQDYKLIPGKSYVKDAKLTLNAGSEASWLFIKVDYNISKDALASTLAFVDGWTKLDSASSDKTDVYYRSAGNTLDGEDDEYPVFAANAGYHFKVADEISAELMEEITDAAASDETKKSIDVTGYAIQSEGLTTPADAWAEFNV